MYFIFVFSVVFISFLIQTSHLTEEKKRKRFCFCAFLIILFVHLFKDNSNYPDLCRYELEFDGIAEIPNLGSFFVQYFGHSGYFHEIGWSLLNFVCTRFVNDFTVFLNIVSIGICSGYSYGIYKLSKSPLFSFLFIMLYSTALPQSFYVLRQHLAFSLFFFVMPHLLKNDYKRFLLGYCCILSLHLSSIILFPFVLFYKLGDRLFTFKRIFISVLLIFSFTYLLNTITYERYADYATTESSGNFLAVILTGGVFFVFIIIRASIYLKDQYNIYMQTYIFYSFIICFACIGSDTGRLTNYFTFFLSSSVPYVVQNMNKPIRLIAYTLFIVFSVLVNLNAQWASYLYYKLIF